ncbi:hypothetical protein L345_11005, partial [Ophiophagus hannah]
MRSELVWLETLRRRVHSANNFAIQSIESLGQNSQETPMGQRAVAGSGAIVAAIVVGVIVIFTTVLLILKTYNRHMRIKRELEPKNAKTNIPCVLGQDSSTSAGNSAVTFVPVP